MSIDYHNHYTVKLESAPVTTNTGSTCPGTPAATSSAAAEFAAAAERRLAERGERESRDLHDALQRERVVAKLARRGTELGQLTLAFAREEMRQLEADMRHWRRRLDRFERDLEHESARVREFYEVRARRVEPVDLVYLWPETN